MLMPAPIKKSQIGVLTPYPTPKPMLNVRSSENGAVKLFLGAMPVLLLAFAIEKAVSKLLQPALISNTKNEGKNPPKPQCNEVPRRIASRTYKELEPPTRAFQPPKQT